jgi:hypothetical protein
MIIFGWGHRTSKQYGPTLAVKCPNCGNDSWWHLLLLRTWFTLFFIPVIPYESKHVLICEVCGDGIELSIDQIVKAKEMNELANALIEDRITKSEYNRSVNDIQLFAQS